MIPLFDSVNFGEIALKNRIIMAPMTRGRADINGNPSADMALYYSQRAAAGLIITESIGISQEGLGWPNAPGLWSDEQVERWKHVTAAVHGAGGLIMAQLWHMGRLVHPSFIGGLQPVSCSATTAPGETHTYSGPAPYACARALRLDEMPRIVNDYVHAAKNAMAAGFDGVQLHAANGYLIDQFLRDGSNFREDKYGGSVENRVRLLREVTEALCETAGAGRVAVRLSPNGEIQGVDDSNPKTLFAAAVTILNQLNIAFVELREPDSYGTFGATDVPRLSPYLRDFFKGPLVTNSDRTVAEASEEIRSGIADAVSFGRPFISNPDLPYRFAHGIALADSDPDTWFSPGSKGYTDYPSAGPDAGRGT